MGLFKKTGVAIAAFLLVTTSWAWDPDKAAEQEAKAQEAIALFKEKDPSIDAVFRVGGGLCGHTDSRQGWHRHRWCPW